MAIRVAAASLRQRVHADSAVCETYAPFVTVFTRCSFTGRSPESCGQDNPKLDTFPGGRYRVGLAVALVADHAVAGILSHCSGETTGEINGETTGEVNGECNRAGYNERNSGLVAMIA